MGKKKHSTDRRGRMRRNRGRTRNKKPQKSWKISKTIRGTGEIRGRYAKKGKVSP